MTEKSASKAGSPWAVFIAIILAFIIGEWVGVGKNIFGITFYSMFELFGTLFINALTLVVVPLVASSIITGIAKMGGDGSFGRLSAKILAFYVSTTLSAVLVGLFFVNLLQPGVSETLRASIPTASVAHLATQDAEGGVARLLLSIVPANIFAAFASGQMLAVILFSLLFGYSLSNLKGPAAGTIEHFFQGLFQVMISITRIVMKCLPLGVFCLVAKTAATTGYSSLASLALFFITVLAGLLFFSAVILPLFLKFVGKVSPLKTAKAMSPALITAFSTSSSAATLPITLDCAEKRAGVSRRICSLVIPLGTSLNMSGSALYECVGALFIAQAYGIELSIVSQISVVLLALITSMGVAGIPSASLVALIVILKACHLPIEGIGLFIAVDRILDMCRTTVNLFSDSCCAILVAKSEGEKDLLV